MNATKHQDLTVAVGWISTAHPPWTAMDALRLSTLPILVFICMMYMNAQARRTLRDAHEYTQDAGAKAARFALSF